MTKSSEYVCVFFIKEKTFLLLLVLCVFVFWSFFNLYVSFFKEIFSIYENNYESYFGKKKGKKGKRKEKRKKKEGNKFYIWEKMFHIKKKSAHIYIHTYIYIMVIFSPTLYTGKTFFLSFDDVIRF